LGLNQYRIYFAHEYLIFVFEIVSRFFFCGSSNDPLVDPFPHLHHQNKAAESSAALSFYDVI